MLYNFAAFLENHRKDYSLADDYYQVRLERYIYIYIYIYIHLSIFLQMVKRMFDLF